MKAEYAQLSHTLAIVTRERDLAVKEKCQLRAKLENLEQVLKVGRRALLSSEFARSPQWKEVKTLFLCHQYSGLLVLFLCFLW